MIALFQDAISILGLLTLAVLAWVWLVDVIRDARLYRRAGIEALKLLANAEVKAAQLIKQAERDAAEVLMTADLKANRVLVEAEKKAAELLTGGVKCE